MRFATREPTGQRRLFSRDLEATVLLGYCATLCPTLVSARTLRSPSREDRLDEGSRTHGTPWSTVPLEANASERQTLVGHALAGRCATYTIRERVAPSSLRRATSYLTGKEEWKRTGVQKRTDARIHDASESTVLSKHLATTCSRLLPHPSRGTIHEYDARRQRLTLRKINALDDATLLGLQFPWVEARWTV